MIALFLGEVVKQLADRGVVRASRRFLVKASRFFLHRGALRANRLQSQRADQPHRPPVHEPAHILAPDQRNMIAELLPEQFDQAAAMAEIGRSEEHTSELQSRE